MTPQLKPALRRLWRSETSIQIGVDPDRAVVIDGLDAGLAEAVTQLNGTRDRKAIIERAVAAGSRREAVERLLRLLDDAGVLTENDRGGRQMVELSTPERRRLAPDVAALSLDGIDGGRGGMHSRRNATVAVYGCGRVGSNVTTLLAASGVGHLIVVDKAPTRFSDLTPGGLTTFDLGKERDAGVRRAISGAGRKANGKVRRAGWNEHTPAPQFAILAPDEEPSRPLAANLVYAAVPHLIVRVVENRAIIGPLVVPGETSCLQCSDLARSARDPLWPDLLREMLDHPLGAAACDLALAATAAAKAAIHVLAFLAGHRPPSLNGTCEITLPLGEERRRTWWPHPECGCQWNHLADSQFTDVPEEPTGA